MLPLLLLEMLNDPNDGSCGPRLLVVLMTSVYEIFVELNITSVAGCFVIRINVTLTANKEI